jgi:hypothetical protein
MFSSRSRRRFVAPALAVALLSVVTPIGIAHASTRPVQPTRLLDTRDDTGGHRSKLGAGEVFALAVGGRADVPASATAVALNVTAVGPDGDGFLSAWPCGAAEPATSSLNFVGGQVVANAVIVGLGTGGKVCLRSSGVNV